MDNTEQFINLLQGEKFLPLDFKYESKQSLVSSIIHCAGDKLYNFDAEYIYDPNDYEDLLKQFDKVTGENRLSEVRAYLDEDTAEVSVKVSGEQYNQEWPQESDWVAEEYYAFLSKIGEKYNGALFTLPAIDQSFNAVYFSSKEIGAKAEEYSRALFNPETFWEV